MTDPCSLAPANNAMTLAASAQYMLNRNTRGFTIIEVLVSMVILSIGVLGLGLLQLTSMQNTQGGYLRSQATILAYDIIDSMRANLPAVTNGDYGIALVDPIPVAVDCFGLAANCSTVQMAKSDLNRWRTLLGKTLPAGNGQVALLDIGDSTQATVMVAWLDPYTAENGSEQLILTSEFPR